MTDAVVWQSGTVAWCQTRAGGKIQANTQRWKQKIVTGVTDWDFKVPLITEASLLDHQKSFVKGFVQNGLVFADLQNLHALKR